MPKGRKKGRLAKLHEPTFSVEKNWMIAWYGEFESEPFSRAVYHIQAAANGAKVQASLEDYVMPTADFAAMYERFLARVMIKAVKENDHCFFERLVRFLQAIRLNQIPADPDREAAACYYILKRIEDDSWHPTIEELTDIINERRDKDQKEHIGSRQVQKIAKELGIVFQKRKGSVDAPTAIELYPILYHVNPEEMLLHDPENRAYWDPFWQEGTDE